MRKVSLLVVTALLAVSTAFATGTEPTSDDKVKSVQEQVAELLEEPNFKVTKEITAEVTLMVNKQNEVVVINVDTKEEFVADFIKARLNYEMLEAKTLGGQITVPVRIIPGD